MAILSSIRKRSFFLILVIAMALFAFILADIITKGGTAADASQPIGEIAGKEIDRQSFDLKVEAEQQQARISQTQAVERVWNREINNILIENEFEAIGLQASSERIKQRIAQDLEGNPLFTDDEGNFSEYMLQEYLNNIRTSNPVAYQQFQDYLNSLEISTKQDQLLQLVVGANMPTLAEAEMLYKLENNKRDIQYLQIPYSSIADSTITVSNAEIKSYMEKNRSKYEVEEQRDIEYVFFEETPSEEDLTAFKSEIAALADDRILDNEITKSQDTLQGLKNTTDYRAFINANSDVPYNDNYLFKTQVPTDVAEKVFEMEPGSIYGPYDEGDFIKLTKIVDKIVIPDSVQSAHILIAFRGATRAPAEVTRTKDEAKQMADSIFDLVKNSKTKFIEIASEVNTDATKDKGGDLGWTTYSSKALDPKFADFIYFNPKGSVDVVETSFGYHVVRIDDQKAEKEAVKLATVSKRAQASEETGRKLYTEAIKFQSAATKDFASAVSEFGVEAKPVRNIKRFDESITGLGSNREIIRWAFDKETKVNAVRRFDLNNGYAVARLIKKTPKGLMDVETAAATALPEIRKQKKAEKIIANLEGTDLNTLASQQGQSLKTAAELNRTSFTLSGAGKEPKVIGAAFGLQEGQVSQPIKGEQGVYVVKVTAVKPAPELDNYVSYVNQLKANQKAPEQMLQKLFEALKNAADIKDKRAEIY